MSKLVAIDVAILPPADVTGRIVALNASLPEEDSEGLRLDADHLPHVTLTQLFVREEELDTAFEHIDTCLRGRPPFDVLVKGAEKSGHTLWLGIESTPEITVVHEELMNALRGLERTEGGPSAFLGEDGRLADVLWVAGYRLKSSFGHFVPHITLGHGREPPAVEPFMFPATTIAACHLGRFCTCGRILRSWTL
jgi:2'-5' RNA ligase